MQGTYVILSIPALIQTTKKRQIAGLLDALQQILVQIVDALWEFDQVRIDALCVSAGLC